MKIFISFAEEGIKYAEDLNNKLIADYETFLSKKDINAGDLLWLKIGENMNESDVIVFIITESSENSSSQPKEVSLGIGLKEKHIIPFIKDGIELSKFVILRAFSFERFSDSDADSKFESFLSKLKNGIYSRKINPVVPIAEESKVKINDR